MEKKNRRPLSTQFEPGMTDTVELTELYGSEPGGIFDFLGREWTPTTVKTCWGELRVMVNALWDYADILEGVIDEWGLEGYHAAAYATHAARCRNIARKYAAAIGYDREKVLRDCHKRRAQAEDEIIQRMRSFCW